MIPLSVPNFEGNELNYVTEAVGQGWVSTGGAYVQKMEDNIAKYLNVSGAVACQSGTAALHLALMECGVQRDELVIVPTLTFIAAVNPVTYTGAQPVFMDCDESLCMNPDKLAQFCEKECTLHENQLVHKETGKRIRALIVVHVFGNMADMEKIMDIANAYHLKVIEDATEALGTRYTSGRYQGKFAGTIGDFGAFSFNGNKIITTGGGGMVTALDPKHLNHIKYVSTQCKDDPVFYVHDEIGYNYRMTNVQAAIGVAQLEYLDEFIRRKQRTYQKYIQILEETSSVSLMPFRKGTNSNCWFYSLFIQGDRDVKQLVKWLSENGVQTRMIWKLIHEQKSYSDCITYQIEKAPFYQKNILNLPCSTNLSDEEIQIVCRYLKIYVEEGIVH